MFAKHDVDDSMVGFCFFPDASRVVSLTVIALKIEVFSIATLGIMSGSREQRHRRGGW